MLIQLAALGRRVASRHPSGRYAKEGAVHPPSVGDLQVAKHVLFVGGQVVVRVQHALDSRRNRPVNGSNSPERRARRKKETGNVVRRVMSDEPPRGDAALKKTRPRRPPFCDPTTHQLRLACSLNTI
jgi:hypothetical protein